MSNGWLDRIEVASPCHEDWNQMSGDERARHCGSCEQTVYDLSGMTRAQAEELVLGTTRGERVCIRYRRRADGTVLTADCPTRLERGRRPSKWRPLQTAAASLLALAGGALGQGCTEEPQVPENRVMGKVRALPIATPQASPAGGEQPCCPDGKGECCTIMGDVAMPVRMGEAVAPQDVKDGQDCVKQPPEQEPVGPVMMGAPRPPQLEQQAPPTTGAEQE